MPTPRGSLVGHAVADWARATPRRAALAETGGRIRTYAELSYRANRLAQGLLARGLDPGDRVAVWLGNRIEYIETYLACARAGLVVVPVNIRFTAEEARFVLEDSGARALVHEGTVGGRVTELDLELTPALDVDTPGFEEFVAAGAEVPPVEPHPDDLLVIGYTSGTTGFPKGAELTHRSVTHLGLTNALACRYSLGSVQVFGLSLSFTATVPAHVLPHLAVGGTTVLLPHWETAHAVAEIAARGADFVILPGPAIGEFTALAEKDPSRVASLRSVLHSASKAPPEQLERLVEVIGPRLVEGWGMTENSGGLLTATTERDYRESVPGIFASVGRAVPGTYVTVVDEAGEPLPHDGSSVGQLVATSGSVARGYWNRPEATEATFGGGTYRTGDLGTIDERGYVSIMDRRSDLIVSGGMNVYPSEIERVLAGLDGVVECVVVGAPHERWGQTPVAFVVAPGRTGAELLEQCRRSLASYKLPSRVVLCEALPRNASGKIVRGALTL
ncbi:AMP-binding protein [Pseudonocardia kujensis]|uniref:class I adenylate-forming enzyme family protein n=1 Tax=Pseudonocardia kujensis TaxID=1128675 RepID=UPI001E420FCD|nr:AMP-binding protein [Pseudonocardia kujensis]MCE0762000.1 AMP-binding protein [Pseudonocardia kujensis]